MADALQRRTARAAYRPARADVCCPGDLAIADHRILTDHEPAASAVSSSSSPLNAGKSRPWARTDLRLFTHSPVRSPPDSPPSSGNADNASCNAAAQCCSTGTRPRDRNRQQAARGQSGPHRHPGPLRPLQRHPESHRRRHYPARLPWNPRRHGQGRGIPRFRRQRLRQRYRTIRRRRRRPILITGAEEAAPPRSADRPPAMSRTKQSSVQRDRGFRPH
jgi:hypothetical protein